MGWFAVIFGIVTLIGGVIGYMQAGSAMSLVSGGVSGAAILASAIAYMKNKAWGYYALVILSALLGGFFIYRMVQTGNPMPAVIIITFATITFFGLLSQRGKSKPEPPNL